MTARLAHAGLVSFQRLEIVVLVQIGASWFAYDERGNQTDKMRTDTPGTFKDRFIRYSSDDKAYEIALGNRDYPLQRTRFWYGPDGQRYKREERNGRRTHYLGNVEVIIEGSMVTYKRMVAGVAQQTFAGTGVTTHYLFKDRLGSLVRITDASGTQVQSRDFDAFGERRDPGDPNAIGGTPNPDITTRGFTGHEHTDGQYATYVVHMNGRLYDSANGRFLQADPIIQEPGNLQSWNAYTYVLNNPLVYTDPTGMAFSFRQILAVVIAAAYFYFTHDPNGTFSIVSMVEAMEVGFATGLIATGGSFKGGVYGALSAGLTYGVSWGAYAQGWGTGATAMAQGFAGGIMATLEGGNFGNGFIAAGLTTLAMPVVGRIDSRLGRTVVGAIVGGTLSEATGGKFANGAVSGAIQAALNGGGSSFSKEFSQKEPYADVTDGAPEELKPLLSNPKTRKAALEKMRAMYGFKGDRGIRYLDVVNPNAVADVGDDLVITFYRNAFFGNFADLGSSMFHEYVHVGQYPRYADAGLDLRVGGTPNNLMEYEAHTRELGSGNPFASGRTAIGRAGTIHYQKFYYDRLPSSIQKMVRSGDFNCLHNVACH